MKKRINIAIDGPSGSGKSSTAKALSKILGMHYLDTGAMYRAVTYHFLYNLDGDEDALIEDISNIILEINYIDGKQVTKINELELNDELYKSNINKTVSLIASKSEVRDFLQGLQRNIAKSKNFIMDGRDIATVIMPDAELKVYLHAPLDTRAERRFHELQNKGINTSLDEIKGNLKYRDDTDSNREHSPLIKHKDAIVVNTDNYTFDEQVEKIKVLAEKLIYEN